MKLIRKAIEDLEVLSDLFSVVRVDLASSLLRVIQPAGFWGDAAGPRTFLTFDDGPSPHTTPALLEMLRETDTRATFFLIGQEAEKYPELVKEIHRDGHAIGNHSYSHKYLPALNTKQIEFEITKANEVIAEITGEKPVLFRPPYGRMEKRAVDCLEKTGLSTIYWTSAPEDWANPGASRVIRRVHWKLKAGGIIVLHEGKELARQTLQAAREIIYSCRHRQLELDRVETCLTSNLRGIMDS